MKGTRRIGVPVPEQADSILDTIASVTKIPKSDIIRTALEEYCARNGFPVSFKVKRGRTRGTTK